MEVYNPEEIQIETILILLAQVEKMCKEINEKLLELKHL